MHRRLDEGLVGKNYFKTVEGYSRYLTSSHDAHIALEALLRTNDAFFSLRPANAAVIYGLQQDLADLHVPVLRSTRSENCRTFDRPSFSDAHQAGVAYALLGASNGAPHILRWAEQLGLSGSLGARHLALQAEWLAGWPSVVDGINALSLAPADEADCIAGAHGVFAIFLQSHGLMTEVDA